MYVHVKHDNCDDQKGGRTGHTRMSVGPYSHKAAVDKMKQLTVEHRAWHRYHRPAPLCIIRIEEEPLC